MMHLNLSKGAVTLLGLMALLAATPAQAAESIVADDNSTTAAQPQKVVAGNLMPTDPQVQQLNRLNDRYQCGIPAINTEIASAELVRNMGTCLNALEVKMASNPNLVSSEDLAQLKSLARAFSSEIGTLENRVTNVENSFKVAQETSTFSTTTKLAGEVIVGLTSFSGNTGSAANSATSGTVLTNRVRLNFDTTFTGKDRLRTRLQSRNTTPLNGATTTNTRMTRLGFDGDEGNTTNLSLLQYTLPVFDRSKLILETVGSEFNENMYTFNPLLASSGGGSLTRFGRYNPVYRQSGDGAAATLDHRFSDEFTASIGYAVPGTVAADPTANVSPSGTGGGVFGGAYAIIGQVRYEAAPGVNLGLNYARSYSPNGANVSGGTGSAFANSPFGAAPTVASHYNFLASAKVSPGFVLSGWAGLTNASLDNGGAGGSADIFNFAVTAAFPDLGAKGNVLGLIVGVPPKVTGSSNAARVDKDTSLHLEALYKIKMSDNLDITPGVLLITNPEHNSSRASEVVGTIRTTFRF
jgi:Carbohydrate-selective porin, OprB family